MHHPSPKFHQAAIPFRLHCVALVLIAAMALTMSTQLWSLAKPTAPVQKQATPAPKAVAWCKNAAPVVGGVATVTISPVGTTTRLKVDYDRVCISKTERVEWKWSGDPSKNWNVEFHANANPFPKNKYGKGNPKSDPPTAPGNDHLIYKYMVHVDGYTDLDPDVIIKGGG